MIILDPWYIFTYYRAFLIYTDLQVFNLKDLLFLSVSIAGPNEVEKYEFAAN